MLNNNIYTGCGNSTKLVVKIKTMKYEYMRKTMNKVIPFWPYSDRSRLACDDCQPTVLINPESIVPINSASVDYSTAQWNTANGKDKSHYC